MTINCTIQNNKGEHMDKTNSEIVSLFFFHKMWLPLFLNFLKKDLWYVKKCIYRLKKQEQMFV